MSQIYKRPQSVLVVVYTSGAWVLLLRRKQPPDYWQSVTGSLEWDETPLEAAARELAEETGLDSNALEDCHRSHAFEIYPVFRERYAPGVTQNLEHVFRLCLPAPCAVALDEAEHDAYQWLIKDVALQWVSSYTNRDAIRDWVPDPA